MTEQRRIDLLFAAAAFVLRAGRAVRRTGPALAMLMVVSVAVHGTLGGTIGVAAPRAAAAPPTGEIVALRAAPPVALEVAAAPPRPGPQAGAADDASEAHVRPVPVLDREQQNVARFIARSYRVTIESTSEFVHHAYRAARDLKVDPLLVLAVMSVESSFNPKAQSHAGAQGLMQVLTRVHVEKFLPFGGIAAAFDPVANIRVGSAILKEYLTREGTVEGALKSYVGAALFEHDGGYGLKVLTARERIAAAAAGRPIPSEADLAAMRRDRDPQGSAERAVPASGVVEARTAPSFDDARSAGRAPVEAPSGVFAGSYPDLRSAAGRDPRGTPDPDLLRLGSI